MKSAKAVMASILGFSYVADLVKRLQRERYNGRMHPPRPKPKRRRKRKPFVLSPAIAQQRRSLCCVAEVYELGRGYRYPGLVQCYCRQCERPCEVFHPEKTQVRT